MLKGFEALVDHYCFVCILEMIPLNWNNMQTSIPT